LNELLIQKNGYLSKVYKPCRQNLYSKYSKAFELFEEFNLFLHKEMTNIPLKSNDSQGIMLAALFVKSLSTFQAIFNLFRDYYCNDAKNLTRVLFEEMVNIGYCSRGEDELKRFGSLEIMNRIKKIEIVHNDFKKEMKEKFFKEKSYEEQIKEQYDKLHDLKIKGLFSKKNKPIPISIRKRVERLKSSEIMHYYRTYYKLISSETHSSPDSLGKFFNFDSKGNLIEIYWGPKAEECNIAEIFFTSIIFMNIICDYLFDYFKIPKKEEVDNFIKKSDILSNKYLKYIDKDVIKWIKISRKNG
jgi:hypothetical protein